MRRIIVKNYFVFWLAALTLSLVGCRSPLWSHSNDSGSGLKGVYDHKHLLRLAQVQGEEGVFRFETCLLKKGLDTGEIQPGSCVGALRKGDEDVTFSLQRIADVNLSDEEKGRLKRLDSSWKHYQNALAQKESASQAAIGVGAAGGVLVLSSAYAIGKAGAPGMAVGLFLVGAVGVGTLAVKIANKDRDLVADKEKKMQKTVDRIEHIQVMVDKTYLMNLDPTFNSRIQTIQRTKLTTPDDPYATEVSSVRPVLEYLSRYQHNIGLTTRIDGDKIDYYCLPSGFDENGEIQKNCYHFSEAKTWCEEADDDGVCIKEKSSY